MASVMSQSFKAVDVIIIIYWWKPPQKHLDGNKKPETTALHE